MQMRSSILASATALAALLAAPTASAQTFATGTVVDGSGAPIAGADLDFFHQDGKESNTRNDGTGANGTFTTEVRDGPDTYDVRVNPPYGAALLPGEVNDVLVVGTKNLGTITLPAGFLVEGRTLNAIGQPVADVSVKVFDSASGAVVYIPHSTTDALGEFKFAVPSGTYDIVFDTSALVGPLLAPAQRFATSVTGALDLGDVTLPNGFVLSATCKRSNGTGILGVDVDVVDTATGNLLYTPGDGSDALGFVDVVVPAGTFDVQFQIDPATKIVSRELLATVVTGTTNLGTLTFVNGFFLSGTVTATATGLPVAAVDVDVIDPVNGSEVYLVNDNSSASGTYQVVVPAGTWNVDFDPPLALDLAAKLVTGVFVNADKVQHATLDACGQGVHYGTAVAGSGGFVPTVASVGDPVRLGALNVDLQISNGLGGATCFFAIGTGSAAIPFKAAALLVDPAGGFYVMVPLPLSGPAGVPGAGSFDVVDEIPNDPVLDGVHLYAQVLVVDAGATKKVAMSDGLDLTICR